MAQKLNPLSAMPHLDGNGDPRVGAKLFIYAAGSSTKITTTKDSAGASNHANPIILNSFGLPADGAGATQAIWQAEGVSAKIVLAPSDDTDPPTSAISTWDNLSGINDTTVTIDQWISGAAPTYVSATSFTLVGDQTSNFHVGRKLKTTNTAGTTYSTISVSAYTSLTTITVVNESGTLDSGLSSVYYGILTATNMSIPPWTSLTADNVESVTATVAASALTVGLNSTSLYFRSSTITDGVSISRVIPVALSLVVPSTATLGTVDAIQSRLILLAIDNAGTVELAIVNQSGGNDLSETGVISTTAIDATADTANVIYSTTARTGVAYRVVGLVDSTQATAGTWATDPTLKQGAGGVALASISSLGYGLGVDETASRASATTYYNTTGKPKKIVVWGTSNTVSAQFGRCLLVVDGVNQQDNIYYMAGTNYTTSIVDIIPPGSSYQVSLVFSIGGALTKWWEQS